MTQPCTPYYLESKIQRCNFGHVCTVVTATVFQMQEVDATSLLSQFLFLPFIKCLMETEAWDMNTSQHAPLSRDGTVEFCSLGKQKKSELMGKPYVEYVTVHSLKNLTKE